MAGPPRSIGSGFCATTNTFHSLRPPITLPPPALPLSAAAYAFSLLPTPLPRHPALISSATAAAVSYPQFLSHVSTLAASLQTQLGLSKGHVAFILSPTSLDVPVLHFALLSLGVVVSPGNPASTAAEVAYQCSLCKPDIAFAVASAASKIPAGASTIILDSPYFTSLLSGEGGAVEPVVVLSGKVGIVDREDFLSARDRTLIEVDISIQKNPTNYPTRGSNTKHQPRPACAFGVALRQQALATVVINRFCLWQKILQSDPAAILYSSGTTGRVKGVVLTHRNLIGQIATFTSVASATVVQFVTAPLFHVYGLIFSIKAIAVAETVVLQTERYEPRRMLQAVGRFRITHLALAPPALLAMLKVFREGGKYNLSSLEAVAVGGAPVGMELIRQFVLVFPNVRLIQAYGLTESTAGVARLIGDEESRRFGSVGRITPGCEAKIVDLGSGDALLPGMRGEIWVRGPTIMKGYIGDQEATSLILTSEGWLKTGDLGYIDNDGFLFIIDRLKELIKYKGYQVPPVELENILQTHPDIFEAAVIPYPHEVAGEVPMAFIVRHPHSTLNEAQTMEFIAKQVAPYKRIHRVSFVNSIPKNAAGKILRRELVKLATSEISSKL